MLLEGDCLGKRQKDLNSKVNDAASKNVPFERFDEGADTSDVCNLFKIDLASKYKKIDYILKVLKSGDGLQISRALHCIWLYDDEHSNLINPDYLHNEVFPSMSNKNKFKFLKTMSTHLRNETRAQDFFQYCLRENLDDIAFKFLIFTSPEFKSRFIEENYSTLKSIILDDDTYIVFLIGNDFSVAEIYSAVIGVNNHTNHWLILRNLYFIDPERFLNNWEKYCVNFEKKFGLHINSFPDWHCWYNCSYNIQREEKSTMLKGTLGLRISKDIMTKHKQRVQKNIKFYCRMINISILRKYTTIEDAKVYAIELLPESSELFWKIRYKEKYNFILSLIPDDEKYDLYRKIFKTKYPDSEFEMTKEFYDQKYYELMSQEQRELWALRHLENPDNTFLSDHGEKNYIWYKFVNYDTAIKEVTKHISIAMSDLERKKILCNLVHSVRNKDHLLKLFQYFYARHVNESFAIKVSFIKQILDIYNIWEFSEECWTVFNKILYSMDLYNPKKFLLQKISGHFVIDCYYDIFTAVLFYHILHEKELPETLLSFFEYTIGRGTYDYIIYCEKIKEKKHQDIICQYLISLYADKIKKCLNQTHPFDQPLQSNCKESVLSSYIKQFICYIKELQKKFNVTNENIPKDVLECINSENEKEALKYYVVDAKENLITQCLMLRYLKQDTQSVLKQLPLLKDNFSANDLKINTFLEKLKIYFSNDLAQKFLKYFIDSLSDYPDTENLSAAVHGIMVLAGESVKAEFMLKYAPSSPKIDHDKLEYKHLDVQRAICRFACYSRPPVPLDVFSKYIVGDYVQHCRTLFYMYMANCLPRDGARFVELLTNNHHKISVQKYGLRLAFIYTACADLEKLLILVKSIWNRSKNISLRSTMYTRLYDEMMKRKGKQQMDLFKVYLTLTSLLNHNDPKGVIDRLTQCCLPEELTGEYFETAWITVNKFPNDRCNLDYRARLINSITHRVDKIRPEVVKSIIDDYIYDIFTNVNSTPNPDKAKFTDLNSAKFKLTVSFIVHYYNEENINSVMPLVQYVLKKCIEMWDDSHLYYGETKFDTRNFCSKFIMEIEKTHFGLLIKEDNVKFNAIFENIIKQLLDFVPILDVYFLIWRLRMAIVTNINLDFLHQTKTKESQEKELVESMTAKYATEIVKCVNEFLNQGHFSVTLIADFSKIIERYLNIMITRKLYNRNTKSTESIISVSLDDAKTFLADNLVKHKSREIMLLATYILPIHSSSISTKERENVICCIKNSDSFDVHALFYRRTNRTLSVPGCPESDSDDP